MAKTHIMIVDDEPQSRRVLRTALVGYGFEISECRSGEEALAALRQSTPDIVLMDLRMPGMGGLKACRAIRANSEVPIIVVSVRQETASKIEALEAGADDYVTKPLDIEELAARIRAVRRRGGGLRTLSLGETEIDLHSREVRRGGQVTHLTAKEFALLDYLAQHPGEIVSHRRLLQAVWGPDYGNEHEYLRVFINLLRKKVEVDPSHPKFILTEPHVGYYLREKTDTLAAKPPAAENRKQVEQPSLHQMADFMSVLLRDTRTMQQRLAAAREQGDLANAAAGNPDGVLAAQRSLQALAGLKEALEQYQNVHQEFLKFAAQRTLKPDEAPNEKSSNNS